MPKSKTHKGVKKRIKVSSTGKLLKRSPGKSHLLSTKSSKRKRRLRKLSLVPEVERRRTIRLLKGRG